MRPPWTPPRKRGILTTVSHRLSLTTTTLRRVRGDHAPVWYSASQMGLDHVVDTSRAPPIGIVTTPEGNRVAGRFFPKVKYDVGSHRHAPYVGPAALIYRHEDPLITLATAVHELAHWLSYCEECSHVPRNRMETVRCRYKGEHDPEFYARLQPLYIMAGVPTYAARAVEGTYDYPAHWKEDEWPR